MTKAELLLLGFDLAMAGIEKWVLDAEIAKHKAAGKTDEEIGDLLSEMFRDEVTAAKAASAAKRLNP